MDNVPALNTNEAIGAAPAVERPIPERNGWLRSAFAAIPSASRLRTVGYSFADQALAVGSVFVANVALARTQTKEEYGMFALSFSVFTFLSALHNSAILEPCTVYGSGRYRNRFSEYLRLMVRLNAFVGVLLSVALLLVCLVIHWVAPQFFSRALLGLGVTVGVLLSGVFLRRVFYLQRQAQYAARASFICFVTVACALWLAARAHLLNGFSVFLILALGWAAAGIGVGNKLEVGHPDQSFLDSEPGYWQEHWRYSKWVFATAFVCQFTSQGYYWLVAGFLSVKQVADLRVMYLMIGPIDQAFVALTLLVLPALAARYASGKMQDFFSLQKRYGMGVVAVTGLFILVVRVAGRPAMHLLYAGRFDDVSPLLATLALLPLVMGFGNVMNLALKAMEKPQAVFHAYLASGVATFMIGLPLVIHSGVRGAVYGMLVSAATYSAILIISFLYHVQKKVWRHA